MKYSLVAIVLFWMSQMVSSQFAVIGNPVIGSPVVGNQLQIINGISCSQCACANNGRCQYDVNSGVSYCICPIGFSGKFCEFNLFNRLFTQLQPWCYVPLNGPWYVTPPPTTTQSKPPPINPCTYLQNLCQNGGQCVQAGFGAVRCVCPIPFTGKYCTDLAYVPCPTQLQLCSTTKGNCSDGNLCVCKNGYRGPRCDEEIKKCEATYCLNDGTCTEINPEPFRKCNCKEGFTGIRCETILGPTTQAPPQAPKCNYRIVLQGTAGYFSRFSVRIRDKSGYWLPAKPSSVIGTIGGRASIDIGDTSQITDLGVMLEGDTGSYWKTFHYDRNLGLKTECCKGYKVWGTIVDPKWDYFTC